MPKYLLSVHTSEAAPPPQMTEEEMRRGYEPVAALEAEMRSAGAFVFGGRLDQPRRSRVVRPSGTRVRTTDGPYAETKEHLGGFYIIETADLDAALDWASKVTLAIDTPIEVRPFVGVTAA
jgi:hypothetical protein